MWHIYFTDNLRKQFENLKAKNNECNAENTRLTTENDELAKMVKILESEKRKLIDLAAAKPSFEYNDSDEVATGNLLFVSVIDKIDLNLSPM